MFESILVPLDGSDRSQEVLNQATEIARKHGSQIILLQAVSPFTEALGGEVAVSATPIIGPSTAAVGPIVSESVVEHARQRQDAIASSAREYLRSVAGHLEAMGIGTVIEVIEGSPAGVILDYSKGNGVGLIAMSTHGRGGLRRVAFGSVADAVLRNARVPILLVRSAA